MTSFKLASIVLLLIVPRLVYASDSLLDYELKYKTGSFKPLLPFSLHKACVEDDLKSARQLIAWNIDVDRLDPYGMLPLAYALKHSNLSLVKLLLAFGASVDCVDKRQTSAIVFSASNGYYHSVEYLLLNEKSVNLKFQSKLDAFFQASYKGHADIMKLLIKHGANVNHHSTEGETLLNNLLRQMNKLSIMYKNKPPTKYSVDLVSGWTESLMVLLAHAPNVESPDINGDRPLHASCDLKRLDLMVSILEAGANINSRGQENFTPLITCAFNDYYDGVEYLLLNGANVDLMAKYGVTALHYACYNGNYDIVSLLIKYKANVNLYGDHGKTVLTFLLESSIMTAEINEQEDNLIADMPNRWCKILQILIENGADPTLAGDGGNCPIELAINLGNLEFFKILLLAGKDSEEVARWKKVAFGKAMALMQNNILQWLLGNGVSTDWADETGYNAFQIACVNRNWKLASFLVTLIDVNCPKNGFPPLNFLLHVIDREKLGNRNDTNSYIKIMRLLVNKGADINGSDVLGDFPLIIAVRIGNIQLVNHLLQANPDVMKKNFNDITALTEAMLLGRNQIFKFLLDKVLKKSDWGESCETISINSYLPIPTTPKIGSINIKLPCSLSLSKGIWFNGGDDRYVFLVAVWKNQLKTVKHLCDSGRLPAQPYETEDNVSTIKLIQAIKEPYSSFLLNYISQPIRLCFFHHYDKDLLERIPSSFEALEKKKRVAKLATDVVNGRLLKESFSKRIQEHGHSIFIEKFCQNVEFFEQTLLPYRKALNKSAFDFFVYLLESAHLYVTEEKCGRNKLETLIKFDVRSIFERIFRDTNLSKLAPTLAGIVERLKDRNGKEMYEKARFFNTLIDLSPILFGIYLEDSQNMISFVTFASVIWTANHL